MQAEGSPACVQRESSAAFLVSARCHNEVSKPRRLSLTYRLSDLMEVGILAAIHRSRWWAGPHPPSPRGPLPSNVQGRAGPWTLLSRAPALSFGGFCQPQTVLGSVLVLQDSWHAETDTVARCALIQGICSKYKQNLKKLHRCVGFFFFFWQNETMFQCFFFFKFYELFVAK